MLTLKRFRMMTDAYGADFQRWPQDVRAEAQALLDVSFEARAVFEAARVLDEAIKTATAREDAARWQPGSELAALARLRSGVAARIAASAEARPIPGRFKSALAEKHQFMLGLNFRWVGMATACGAALMAGFLIGATYTTSTSADNVLAMLQPAPIQILAD